MSSTKVSASSQQLPGAEGQPVPFNQSTKA